MIHLEKNNLLRQIQTTLSRTQLTEAHTHLLKRYSLGQLGFVDLPFQESLLPEVIKHAQRLRVKADTLVVLGIGGSSLGGQTIQRCFEGFKADRKVLFLDNIDPETFDPVLDRINYSKTAFFVVSKSGETAETWAQWLSVYDRLTHEIPTSWKEHVIIGTDPQKGSLLHFTKKNNLSMLPIPSNVGGRFSVLTAVGLFPAAFSGLDAQAFLKGAATLGSPQQWISTMDHPVADLTSCCFAAFERGFKEHVFMPYIHRLDRLSDWFVQLWAESLGKIRTTGEAVGSTPLKAVGVTDQHSQMQLFIQGPNTKLIGFAWTPPRRSQKPLKSEDFPLLSGKTMAQLFSAEFEATRQALQEAERPTYTLQLESLHEESLGMLFQLYEATTTWMGLLMKIDPMDQPGVERAKILTKEKLGTKS